MKLHSYLVHEALDRCDWPEAARIVCMEVGISYDAVLALVDDYDINLSRGEEESISICAGNVYAYWSSLDGFGSVTLERNVPANVIRVYSLSALLAAVP